METRICEVDPLENNESLFAEAAEILKQGGLVALPTETVYGLGADALNPEAVVQVFEAKSRPRFDPLIVHLASARELEQVAVVPDELSATVQRLAAEFWPGPFTMVLPKAVAIPDVVTGGLNTVAVRVSAHPVMKSVIKALGHPIAAPSANRFGRISPTCASAVMKELGGRIPLILDAGACTEGLESTIVQPMVDDKGKAGIRILRQGPVTREQFRNVVKIIRPKPTPKTEDNKLLTPPIVPGQLASHYAPGKKVILKDKNETFVPDNEELDYGLLSFEGTSTLAESYDWTSVYTLSPGNGRLAEAAVRLFAVMRQMDEDEDIDVIVAECLPETGIGAAMMDRLRRASADRT